MQFKAIQRILGLLLMLFSLTMLPPIMVGWLMGDPDLSPFWDAGGVLFVTGIVLWVPVRRVHAILRTRDGFLLVTLFWVVLSLAGALPFVFSDAVAASFTDGVFETASGLTTTGATVFIGLDGFPRSILFWRTELHWLGGMGVIVLAVAIMPMLGVGGMQIYKAEAPGPIKDAKLEPRIAETAKLLWYTYLALTILCVLAFRLAGMDWFDAIGYSFSTLGTGGFANHDSSLAYFSNPAIHYIAVLFMFLAGANFGLHFIVWRSASFKPYLEDSEFRFYFLLTAAAILVVALSLYAYGTYPDPFDALRYASVQVVSVLTSTGLVLGDHSVWPSFLPIFITLLVTSGGCSGSTGGGMKSIRFLLLLKQAIREINLLVHPRAHIPIKVNGQVVDEQVVKGVWGFFFIYAALFILFMLGLMADGLDQVTAFSAVAATINNMGLGLGDVSANFAPLSNFSKWWLSLCMIMGRLELLTVLVLLTPAFWRR
ncbi:TrkH family potassium uptake protein [Candidatus Thiothrix sp. Deng01]|uniref:Trk system potassium uptake protein n=1 Tax=Candidatus Thiothrix phosphatis TaxID=3112415 RepID=A0ABU6D107_9GAMM|nr:TrkH family potassium uptake protein [Candidatus Thiothrix sp. Deng01]MEB4592536.1 TrkH family potassium uptake protein [Candidatus Thiothrix sp. Deng01]